MNKDEMRVFGVLAMTPKLIDYLLDTWPRLHLLFLNTEAYEFVKIYRGEVYFFSVEYLEQHSLEEVLGEFAKTVNEQGRNSWINK